MRPAQVGNIKGFPRRPQASILRGQIVAAHTLAEIHLPLVQGELVTSDAGPEVQDANMIYYLCTAWGGEKTHKSVLDWSF